MKRLKRYLKWAGLALVVILVAIQLIPIDRTNPPVTREIKWDSAQMQALAERACNDCHSNETTWLWYDDIAPASWLVANHISDGRRHLNFSEWDKPNSNFDEVSRVVKNGEMPMWDYVLMHPNAKLTPAETQQLLDGLQATFQQDPPVARQGRASN
jgi:cytochrome c551/c552